MIRLFRDIEMEGYSGGHVTKISYQKVFPLASYVNEKIGVEIELERYDDPEVIFKKCKELVNSWGTKPIEHEIDVETGFPSFKVPYNPPSIKPEPIPVRNIAKDQTEIAIDNATSIEQLDLLMGDAAKYGLAKELNEKKRKLNESIGSV